mmetsp:Transcript_726/g.917  ORF Transcript_726/g.917 Transcript_726/m.917 type:complete len:120 (-) Transcript_726:1375-1734(-)
MEDNTKDEVTTNEKTSSPLIEDPYAGLVVASRLKLKVQKKRKKKRSALVLQTDIVHEEDDDQLTEAERRHKKRALEKRKEEAAKAVNKTHRERVEEFNNKLSTLTEHNDIPRVSAAGNG